MKLKRINPQQAAFTSEVPRGEKATAGRTPSASTPLAIRTTGIAVDPALREHVRVRLGRKLGKLAYQIERLTVRFEDLNGPRGGVDTSCTIKVVLSGLPSVVLEERAAEAREAVDAATDGVERAVRRALDRADKHDAGRHAAGRHRGTTAARAVVAKETGTPRSSGANRKRRALPPPEDGSLIGRRVGRAEANLARVADRPGKQRGDATVDTALAGWSATDRRVGGSSTATRNTRLNTAKALATLEDSAQDRPSRKSTRKSANGARRDNSLRERAVNALHAPTARATKAASQRQ